MKNDPKRAQQASQPPRDPDSYSYTDLCNVVNETMMFAQARIETLDTRIENFVAERDGLQRLVEGGRVALAGVPSPQPATHRL